MKKFDIEILKKYLSEQEERSAERLKHIRKTEDKSFNHGFTAACVSNFGGLLAMINRGDFDAKGD